MTLPPSLGLCPHNGTARLNLAQLPVVQMTRQAWGGSEVLNFLVDEASIARKRAGCRGVFAMELGDEVVVIIEVLDWDPTVMFLAITLLSDTIANTL